MLGILKKMVGTVEYEQQQHQVTFRMRVPAGVKKDGGTFVASCDILDVHSQGETEKQALENLVEALQLFVETCFEKGTLEQVLQAQGFAPGSTDELVSGGRTVEVPLALIARQHAENHAH